MSNDDVIRLSDRRRLGAGDVVEFATEAERLIANATGDVELAPDRYDEEGIELLVGALAAAHGIADRLRALAEARAGDVAPDTARLLRRVGLAVELAELCAHAERKRIGRRR